MEKEPAGIWNAPSNGFELKEESKRSRHGFLNSKESLRSPTRKFEPIFKFDPNSIAKLFYPYQKASLTLGENREIEQRVIAPVPDKSTGLKGTFVGEMYRKADELIGKIKRLICIGYDFNHNDLSSYEPILRAIERQGNCLLILVAPNADEIVGRILKYLPELKSRTTWIGKSFKQWAQDDFSISH